MSRQTHSYLYNHREKRRKWRIFYAKKINRNEEEESTNLLCVRAKKYDYRLAFLSFFFSFAQKWISKFMQLIELHSERWPREWEKMEKNPFWTGFSLLHTQTTPKDKWLNHNASAVVVSKDKIRKKINIFSLFFFFPFTRNSLEQTEKWTKWTQWQSIDFDHFFNDKKNGKKNVSFFGTRKYCKFDKLVNIFLLFFFTFFFRLIRRREKEWNIRNIVAHTKRFSTRN